MSVSVSVADRLIVALDVPTLDDALALTERLAGVARRFKVGLELYCAEGPRAVTEVRARSGGGGVFLDLKLHDIPATVRRAAKSAAMTGAELLTVHAAGGRAMLETAVAGAREGGDTKILAVTVLTSLDVADLAAVGTVTESVEALVVKRALLAQLAGCHGVIASPREAARVRAAVGPGFLIITPGVRPSAASADAVASGLGDQKRVATAREAILAGADAVVVGRPIRDAADPRVAAAALLDEMR